MSQIYFQFLIVRARVCVFICLSLSTHKGSMYIGIRGQLLVSFPLFVSLIAYCCIYQGLYFQISGNPVFTLELTIEAVGL